MRVRKMQWVAGLLLVGVLCSERLRGGSGPLVVGSAMLRAPASGEDLTFTQMSPPTQPIYTTLRTPEGLFHAARFQARLHQGVDLILSAEETQCLASAPKLPPEAFEVYAVAAGTVVYARQNGESFDKGLGFTVVIDHGSDIFSLYSHLAQDPGENRCLPPEVVAKGGSLTVQAGQRVAAGERIGYLGRTPHPDDANSPYFPSYDGASGNALRTEQPIQLRFEFFQASSCAPKCVPTAITSIVPAAGRGKLNPMPFLKKVGLVK